MTMNTRFSLPSLLASAALLFSLTAHGQQEFVAGLLVAEAIQPDLEFGMVDGASDGFDDFDERGYIPPFPGGGVVAYFQINAPAGDDKLHADMRPLADNKIWTLKIEGLATGQSTLIQWALPADDSLDNVELEFRSQDDSLGPVDMRTETQATVQQNGTYLIVYKLGDVNLAPIARDDTYFIFAGDPVPVVLDVLANDEDLDPGDAIAIVPGSVTDPSGGGTATIVDSNTRIEYTPPPAPFTGAETFDYTIQDLQGAQATATVTVHVNEHVFAERSHRDKASIGSQLEVTLEVRHSGALESLRIEEYLPVGELPGGAPVIWEYVDGSFSMEDPTEGWVATVTANELTLNFHTNIPPSPIIFTYRVLVPDQVSTQRDFAGDVFYTLTPGGDEETWDISKTHVLPGTWHHSADTDQNWRISTSEFIRVLTLYNNNKYYKLNPDQDTNPTADGYMPSDTPVEIPAGRYHSADTDQNGRISTAEFIRVLTLYNNNRYYRVNPDQDTNPTVDGYIPADSPPNP